MPFVNFPIVESGDFEAPKVLYHYTTLDGFLGILQSKALWASECRCLNDSTEYSHGQKVFDGVLKRRAKNARGETKRFYSDYRRAPLILEGNHTLVASLTEEGDLLSQWRAYGGGCSIGFSYDALVESLGKPLEWGLVKCVYTEEAQVKMSDGLIQGILDDWRDGPPEPTKDPVTGVEIHTIRVHPPTLLRMLGSILPPAFKSESFSEEREWRLIHMEYKASSLRFRTFASRIIPFMPFEFGANNPGLVPHMIREVVVGPSPHPTLLRDTVKFALEAHGFNAQVRMSDCPFRSW
jgi:hypothetical protein